MALALAALLTGWPLVPVAGQGDDQREAPTRAQQSTRDHRSVLSDPQASDDQLHGASRQLVGAAMGEPDQKKVLIKLLLDPPSPRAVRFLLAELARSGTPSSEIVSALGHLLDPADLETTRLALQVLALAHSADAVAMVVGLLDEDSTAPPALRLEVITALKRQTGLVDIGDTPESWRAWWQTAQFLPQTVWHKQIAVALGARADALHRALRERTDEVVELHRQLHVLTDEERRQAFLSELIVSPTAQLRALGLELTQRRLLNARPIDDAIVLALATLLTDPAPKVRVDAADLLARLGRPETMQHVLAALLRETDDSSAAALLTAASRHPQPALLLPALQWLEEGTVSRVAAINTLLLLIDSGTALDPIQEARVRSVLLQMATNDVSRSVMALLVELRETQTVMGLLQSDNPQQVDWAADVLATKGVAIDALIRTARDNQRVVMPALVALERHQPTAQRFAQALELVDLNDPDHASALTNLAQALQPRALLSIARGQTDLKTLGIMLAPAGEVAFYSIRTDCTARVELAIMLAKTKLGLGLPNEALIGLRRLPMPWRGPRIQVLEIDSLLRLDRIDEATAMTAAAASALGLADPFIEPWLANIKASDELGAVSLAITLRLGLGDLLDERAHARIDVLVGPNDDEPAPAHESTVDGSSGSAN